MYTYRFRIKYPKLTLLVLTFLLAYMIFASAEFRPLQEHFSRMGYLGSFLAGVLFVYGFTAAPATAIFLILAKQQHIVIAALIGGLGALAGDLLLFKFIKTTFSDEIEQLKQERLLDGINHHVLRRTPGTIRRYLLPVIAGFIIASPLPDEIGVSLLAASFTISTRDFSALSYILNTIGIFLVLAIGTAI